MIVLNSFQNVFHFTCDQAGITIIIIYIYYYYLEIILLKCYELKFISHFELVEKLLFQISSTHERCSFLTRNLYFDEVCCCYCGCCCYYYYFCCCC